MLVIRFFQAIVDQIQNCLSKRFSLSRPPLVELQASIHAALLERFKISKSDIFTAVDEAGDIMTRISEYLPRRIDGTRRSILTAFVKGSREETWLSLPIVFLGTHLTLQVTIFSAGLVLILLPDFLDFLNC
jgi:hypothetical protein